MTLTLLKKLDFTGKDIALHNIEFNVHINDFHYLHPVEFALFV